MYSDQMLIWSMALVSYCRKYLYKHPGISCIYIGIVIKPDLVMSYQQIRIGFVILSPGHLFVNSKPAYAGYEKPARNK